MARTAKCIVLAGFNGTGKSTMLKKLVEAEVKAGGKALIVTPDDIEWPEYHFIDPEDPGQFQFKGVKKIIYNDTGTIEQITTNFRNGILPLDDCRSYLTAQTDKEIHRLLIRRRQMQVDVVAVGHGFTEIPPKFFTFATHFILFKTEDDIYSRKNVIRDFDKMLEAQARINKKAETDPHYFEVIRR